MYNAHVCNITNTIYTCFTCTLLLISFVFYKVYFSMTIGYIICGESLTKFGCLFLLKLYNNKILVNATCKPYSCYTSFIDEHHNLTKPRVPLCKKVTLL